MRRACRVYLCASPLDNSERTCYNHHMDSAPPATDEKVRSGALERIQRWLLTEVADNLKQPGNMTVIIHLDSSRENIKAVVERFVEL